LVKFAGSVIVIHFPPNALASLVTVRVAPDGLVAAAMFMFETLATVRICGTGNSDSSLEYRCAPALLSCARTAAAAAASAMALAWLGRRGKEMICRSMMV
jgi:hypothetical protein